jgi:hypothetical protein
VELQKFGRNPVTVNVVLASLVSHGQVFEQVIDEFYLLADGIQQAQTVLAKPMTIVKRRRNGGGVGNQCSSDGDGVG